MPKQVGRFGKSMLALLLAVAFIFSGMNVASWRVKAEDENIALSVTVNTISGNPDWAEYNYTLKNESSSAMKGIKIVIPFSGTVSNLQSWNCSVSQSGNNIIIKHTAEIAAGATYNCNSDTKFGFGGGATLGTPRVELMTEEDSADGLKYPLTGETKDVAPEDTPVGKHGKLRLEQVDGYTAPIIVDESGNPFQLRGASTHGMHWGEMHPYVNKGSFQSLRDEWGVNMVRLVNYITQGGYTEGSQSLLDTKTQAGVEAATELGMYVIIDWHVHAENPHTKKAEAKAFFEKYATMYKDYDNVIFEICNEPTNVNWYNNGSGGDLYSYCKEIAQTIRDCGSDALIVCGTNTWSQDVDDVAKKPLKDDGFENILYTFHFYSGSHYDDKMQKVRTAIKAGTPIFVTEFGICDASGNGGFDTANADAWIQLCDENNISYACWSLCNKNESASYLSTSCNKTNGGWVASDLATTGIWLVNTYRAHEEEEIAKENPDVVYRVSLNKTKLTLAVDKSETLNATIIPASALNKEVTWSSDKPAVATVDNGKVTAVAEGTATITVTTVDGKKTAKCIVTVTATGSGNGDTGSGSGSTGSGSGDTGSGSGSTGSGSGNTGSGSGNTGSGSGNTGSGNGTSGNNKVNEQGDENDKDTIVPALKTTNILMQKGKTYTLTTNHKDVEITKISYSNSNSKKLVKVSSSGKIKAKKTGTAKLKVTYEYDGTSYNKTVKVKIQKNAVYTLNKKNTSIKMKRKAKCNLVNPANMLSSKGMKFKTSNKKVATVSSKGLVTAKKKGTAKITVTMNKTKYTVTVKVR